MRRTLRNRKGITPVLSSLLLMVIAVAAMSIAITATYVITYNLRETMGERFILEDVWFKTGEVSIYLRNTGKVPIRIVSVYIEHVSQSINYIDFDLNGHDWLDVPHNWIAGRTYYINVVTTRGTQIADSFEAPSA